MRRRHRCRAWHHRDRQSACPSPWSCRSTSICSGTLLVHKLLNSEGAERIRRTPGELVRRPRGIRRSPRAGSCSLPGIRAAVPRSRLGRRKKCGPRLGLENVDTPRAGDDTMNGCPEQELVLGHTVRIAIADQGVEAGARCVEQPTGTLDRRIALVPGDEAALHSTSRARSISPSRPRCLAPPRRDGAAHGA